MLRSRQDNYTETAHLKFVCTSVGFEGPPYLGLRLWPLDVPTSVERVLRRLRPTTRATGCKGVERMRRRRPAEGSVLHHPKATTGPRNRGPIYNPRT